MYCMKTWVNALQNGVLVHLEAEFGSEFFVRGGLSSRAALVYCPFGRFRTHATGHKSKAFCRKHVFVRILLIL